MLCVRVAAAAPAHDPQAIVIVLDRSQAMAGDRLPVAKAAVLALVDNLDARDRIAVVTYDGLGTGIAARLAAPDRDKLAAALDQIGAHGRSGDLAEGIELAFDQLAITKLQHRRLIAITASDDVGGVRSVLDRHADERVSVATIGVQLDNPIALDVLNERGQVRLVDDLIGLRDVLETLAQRPPIAAPKAIVFVIDRSGSVDPDKLDIAKLPSNAFACIVAFDSEAVVLVKGPARERWRFRGALDHMTRGGGTNIFPGLHEAFELLSNFSSFDKRVVLISDGDAPTDGLAELVTEMRQSRIVTSAIGLPGTSDVLAMIAEAGSGRFYSSGYAHIADELLE